VSLPFALPPQEPGKPRPVWLGNGFRAEGDYFRILDYSSNAAGWNDNLTSFHEETAGSDHFIDRASRQHALDQLIRYAGSKPAVILEVGCSSGYLLAQIANHFTESAVLGADVVKEPLEQLAPLIPHVPLFRFDLVQCPFPEESIDAVVLLNVLEHIENDSAAMAQVFRILKPNGIAVIEVPAGPHLYDVYDQSLMHFRRYALSDLRRLVRDANLRIIEQSHLGFLLYPGFCLVKRRNRRLFSKSADAQRQVVEQSIRNTGSSGLLGWLMDLELAMGHWLSYPFGIRCLLTCAKQ
jgi:ubiquinone/menaquinone biosynthesis C-methylase UbiE